MFGKIRSLFRRNREGDDPDLTFEKDDRELTYERALRLVRAAIAHNFCDQTPEETIRRKAKFYIKGTPVKPPLPGTTEYYNLAESAADVLLEKYPKQFVENAQNIITLAEQDILAPGVLVEAAKMVVERMGKEYSLGETRAEATEETSATSYKTDLKA